MFWVCIAISRTTMLNFVLVGQIVCPYVYTLLEGLFDDTKAMQAATVAHTSGRTTHTACKMCWTNDAISALMYIIDRPRLFQNN